jgi:hypothetical protein
MHLRNRFLIYCTALLVLNQPGHSQINYGDPEQLEERLKQLRSRKGPAQSPLNWRAAQETVSPVLANEIRKKSHEYLGHELCSDSLSAEVGFFSDKFPFWETLDGRKVWKVKLRGIKVENPHFKETDFPESKSVQIDLSLILDHESKQLIAAFTDPKDIWAQPSPTAPGHDPEAETAIGAKILPLGSAKLETSVIDVLGLFWRHVMNPEMSGQLILRPRLMENSYPPEMIEGQLAPNKWGAKPWWIIQSLGAELPQFGPAPTYKTSIIFELYDGDHQWFQMRPMP